MYKLCKTEQSAKRQREIESIMLSLMCEKRFDDIKVSEICDIANMPRKAFYRYFDSKDSALQAMIDHNVTDYQTYTVSRGHRKRTLQGEFEEFFIFWKDKKRLLDAFEKSNLTGLLIQSSSSNMVGEFVNIKKFLPDEDEDTRTQVFPFAIAGLITITINWYRSGFKASIADMARVASRLVSKPLFPSLNKYGIEI